MILSLLPCMLCAQIPAIKSLGKEAVKVKDVEHVSVGRFMLGMASAFADKEERAALKMLDNIEIIGCDNLEYAPSLSGKVLQIMDDIGASLLATQDDGKALNKVYALHDGEVVSELIVVVHAHDGALAVFAISGEIPMERLDEISKIKP